ncbi:MAG TPA: DUF1464 family protein [Gemmataceae bacterium]|nr:DUF1464 family protein [Gemmataceae bacterium]
MKPIRVAGCDPGTSSLDVLLLENGAVADQARFSPEQLRIDPSLPVSWLVDRGPLDLVAGPSGYGLPLVRAADCTEREFALMSLVRPDERGRAGGVAGFSAVVRAFAAAPLPVVFLPGVIHLPTVPAHRKINRIDLGTPDKLCVAALAVERLAAERGGYADCHCCAIELGTVFTACVVSHGGRIVDGLGGTSGPVGWGGPGAWDGEAAYLLSPLAKGDLFAGGAAAAAGEVQHHRGLRESLVKAVMGLQALTPFETIFLSGQLFETVPDLFNQVREDFDNCGGVRRLSSLPGARVKHAAQGAAILADGLAGGKHAPLVGHLRLREAAGTVLDWLRHPRADAVRAAFGIPPGPRP